MTEVQETRPLLSPRTGQVDITPVLGTWLNTHDQTQWIKKLVLAKKGDAFTLRPSFVQEPSDWGEVEITTYREYTKELGFHAVCEAGGVKAVLAANMNKGLIIIVAFYQFADGRENILSREFYFQESSSI